MTVATISITRVFKTVLDNIIHRLECAPLVAVLTHPVDRLSEYAADEQHAAYLVENSSRRLNAATRFSSSPHNESLWAPALVRLRHFRRLRRCPDAFGKLLLQSGSFAFTDIGSHKRGPRFDRVVQWMNKFREAPRQPANEIFLSCGTYESLIYENRSLVPLLQGAGDDVLYEEARDGHNWENWRDRLRSGLSWLFPGPLWFVYE